MVCNGTSQSKVDDWGYPHFSSESALFGELLVCVCKWGWVNESTTVIWPDNIAISSIYGSFMENMSINKRRGSMAMDETFVGDWQWIVLV